MKFQEIEKVFEQNIDDIFNLMEFDRIILDFSIKGLEQLQETLKKAHQIDNPRQLAENTLQMIKSVRENDSLRPKYQVMFNQSIVLLVSIFAASVGDLFREGVCLLAKKGDSNSLKAEELKLSISDLLEFDGDITNRLGTLVSEKNDLSFQDMKSIGRAFNEYFDFHIEKDVNVNNIIMAQAGRHVIVHDASRINNRIIKQVSGAKPRTLEPDLSGDKIQFKEKEVKLAAHSMKHYFKKIRIGVEARLSS